MGMVRVKLNKKKSKKLVHRNLPSSLPSVYAERVCGILCSAGSKGIPKPENFSAILFVCFVRLAQSTGYRTVRRPSNTMYAITKKKYKEKGKIKPRE